MEYDICTICSEQINYSDYNDDNVCVDPVRRFFHQECWDVVAVEIRKRMKLSKKDKREIWRNIINKTK